MQLCGFKSSTFRMFECLKSCVKWLEINRCCPDVTVDDDNEKVSNSNGGILDFLTDIITVMVL